MKKIYNYLFPVFFSLCAIVACDEENDEIIPMSYTDPVASVTKVTPAEGYVGNKFTISGDDFGVRTADIEVYIGSQKAEVVSCEDKEIVAKVPETATNGKISVVVYGQRLNTELAFRVLGKPGVTKVTPAYGFPGAEIKFEGQNFISKGTLYTLKFNSEDKADIIGTPTEDLFTAKVPATAQSGEMTLVMAEQTVDLASYPFTVLKHATITVPEAPLSGFAGSALTIEGTDLVQELLDKTAEKELPPLKVMFAAKTGDEEPVEAKIDMETLTANSISLTVPANLKAGKYNISVVTPFETIGTQLAYTVLPTPEVEKVEPMRGYVGSKITISGKNFVSSADGIEVKFGETPATEISVDTENANNIIVTVPAMTEFGSMALSLTVQGTEIAMSEYATFEVLESPVISSVITDNAFSNKAAQAGTKITITGKGFTNSTIAESLFNGQPLNSITVVNDTEITATVSENSEAGEGVITLHFEGVDADVVSEQKITMLKAGSDITQYVLKNYKRPFTYITEGGDKGYYKRGEWAKATDWIVEGSRLLEREGGAAVDLTFKPSYGGGNVAGLALQTDWGFDNTKENGKIYQESRLSKGKYKLTAHVYEYGNNGFTGYVAVCKDNKMPNTSEFNGTTDPDKVWSLSIENAATAITATGDVPVVFTVEEDIDVVIGFVATITAKQGRAKIDSFKLELAE